MSFSSRYLITLFSNIIRGGLNFAVSIQVAKYFMPEAYGNYQYTLTISAAILLFLNLGTENAFFTFISIKKQHIKFYLTYFSWQLIQILIVIFIILIINHDMYQLLFKDLEKSLVLVALIALFFVGNIQNSVNHMLESIRKTYLSQISIIFIAILHFILVLTFLYNGSLNVKILFQILLFEYVLYLIIIAILFKKYNLDILSNEEFDLTSMISKFYIYCKPLVILAIASVIYTVTDRWLIQNYIGPEAQAYFSISMQFAALSILVTSSISTIFRKEISESYDTNIEKTKTFFEAVSKNVFLFTSLIATLFFIFSDDILVFFYSDLYSGASLVFKLIMLLPILQSMTIIYVSFFYATEQVKISSRIAYTLIPFSLGLSVFFLADFGLNMDVEAIAIRLLISDFIYVIILEFYICKYLDIPTNLFFKILYFSIFLLIAYTIKYILSYFELSFLYQGLVVSILYVLPVSVYIFFQFKAKLNFSKLIEI